MRESSPIAQRVCPRAGFGASFTSAGGPLLGNTVPIVDVPRVGQVQVAPRPPQPLRSRWAGGGPTHCALAGRTRECAREPKPFTAVLSTNREREDSFRKQKEDEHDVPSSISVRPHFPKIFIAGGSAISSSEGRLTKPLAVSFEIDMRLYINSERFGYCMRRQDPEWGDQELG